jgi:hypothetical protein
MISIAAALAHSLASIERPGEFCVGGLRPIVMPAIDIDGVGRLALPLLPVQAERLVALAEPAPYGRGAQTLVDREVRRTWQIAPAKVRIAGRHWQQTLAELVAAAAEGLGVTDPVTADFYKLLIYDQGSFFVDHRDTEKAPGMFATLAIVLPSPHRGGELVVRHLGREVVFDLRPDEPSEIGFVAFYADCVHEVRPLVEGFRLTLIYNLRFLGKDRPPKAPDYRREQSQTAEVLRRWAGTAEEEPDKLVLPLDHAYTQAELSFATLKGADAGIASVLVKAAAEADCEIHLALVSIEESGAAEYNDEYAYRRRRGRDAEDEDEFEAGEVFDRTMELSNWRSPDGGDAGFGALPFSEDEFCPPDAFDELSPDEEHFSEASGNEGASFERTYRRAGLVLWPRRRRLAVLNQAGLAATLPHLADLAARWQASGTGLESPLWREADELSRMMLDTWPNRSWQAKDAASRFLDLQVELGNAACIDLFLAELSANGQYAAADNEAIVRAAGLLGRSRATDLLARILLHNGRSRFAACAGLLLRCTAAAAPVEQVPLGAAMLEVLTGEAEASASAEQPEPDWDRGERFAPGALVDLLTALSRIDAGGMTGADFAARAVAHVLAWPSRYDPDAVLVPAAVELRRRPESAAAAPAIRRLIDACRDHLRARIGLPLAPPKDWARDNPLRCTCDDCRQLGVFLVDAGARQWRLKAVQHRRTHVEESVRGARCDLDLATERRGSPHTLIATKNQASYERRLEQRHDDIAHLAALGG